MIRLEVRCCCQPQKLLGYLPVADHLVRSGATVRFLIPATLTNVTLADTIRPKDIITGATVSLPVDRLQDGPESHLALKSEETPLSVLRRIPGFIEA